MTGFMVNRKDTLLQTDYIMKRADLPKRLWYLLEFLGKDKTRIHFIDTERTKVNSESYKNLLEIGLLPDCRRLYPNADWVFQQDGAPAHTSKTTQEYLDGATPDFIRKDEWPLLSPDCNPMDYAVWDSLSQKVYAGKQDKFTENELKKQI